VVEKRGKIGGKELYKGSLSRICGLGGKQGGQRVSLKASQEGEKVGGTL